MNRNEDVRSSGLSPHNTKLLRITRIRDEALGTLATSPPVRRSLKQGKESMPTEYQVVSGDNPLLAGERFDGESQHVSR